MSLMSPVSLSVCLKCLSGTAEGEGGGGKGVENYKELLRQKNV